jgi:hypothetical protein
MFLRNGWYAASWSHEIEERPIGRTILNLRFGFAAISLNRLCGKNQTESAS